MKKKYIFFFIISFSLVRLSAQLPVGTFREHLPYDNFKSVAVAPDAVYAAGETSILRFNKQDKSLSTWSKIDGLSDVGISKLYYLNEKNTLIIAYQNANLDFVKENQLLNMPDIKNKQIIGSKTINNFFVYDNYLYLSCGFGVVVLNTDNFLVKETWFTRTANKNYEVKEMTASRNKFFIATDDGLFFTPTNNPNIADFSTWEPLIEAGNGNYIALKYFNGNLIAQKYDSSSGTDSLFVYNHNDWRYIDEINYEELRAIDVRGAEMLICEKYRLKVYDTQFQLIYTVNSWYNRYYENGQDAKFDGTDDIWIGDRVNGLVKINRRFNKKEFYFLDGPHSYLAHQIDSRNGNLAVVPGSNVNYQKSYTQGNFSYLYNKKWGICLFSAYDNLFAVQLSDLCCVAINPKNSQEVFAGSWGQGLVQYNTDAPPTLYNPENSLLQYSTVHEGLVFVGDVTFDNNGRLWMTNSFCANPICMRQADNRWFSFSLNPYLVGSNVIDKILVDSRNYKWVTAPQLNKLVVFSENGTPSNPSDDKIRNVDLNTLANVKTSTITCLAEDLDGEIWIGTNQGVKVIYNPQNALSETVFAKNIIIEVNSGAQNLLEFENITAITVDAANRKWIGTSKAGAFLISANGTEELLHLNEKNSPLFSNQINDIIIDNTNGEIFFATDKGIISYRGTASEAKEDYNDVMVFPNPVRENYQGTISVSGLMYHSFCKIVDAAGNLVWQGFAEGGQLNWNGKDFYGKKPATGVYYVFSSDETGKQRNVAKILFIK
ncbi:MAG TPA: hypothetical protein GXZ40_04505 [Bacteroidales bacterium]|nr:hypothetical protein [Bacteroidales bacterium]